MQIVQCVWLP
ncbi:hypothetical protein Avbf_04833 [Armadillidium vulgare]|nr:hypothetical protein Avbf_04833 [Armadillidium vulgare]